MTEGLEAITAAALSRALDAAQLRQQAIATNIANATNEGFTPLRVSFEAQLEDARRAIETRGHLDAASLIGAEPVIEQAPPGPGGALPLVQLDQEVADMSRNAVHYQALLKGLARHYELLGSAISEGKR
jgi:flagellar basal-body rod protein FlgB